MAVGGGGELAGGVVGEAEGGEEFAGRGEEGEGERGGRGAGGGEGGVALGADLVEGGLEFFLVGPKVSGGFPKGVTE